jgi:hypothetical protein
MIVILRALMPAVSAAVALNPEALSRNPKRLR